MLSLLGAALASDLLARQSPQAVRARTIALLVQWALQGARQQPLVLEVENLHWCDPSSAEVLGTLVERLAGVALLLLTTYRPGYRPPWLEKSYATQVPLTRLTPADSQRIVQAVLGPTPVAEALVQAVIARAGGNPLFVEELARAVVEAGAGQLPEAVPATIEAVLAARLDRLPPAVKHVVQVAAVLGSEVPGPLLQVVLGWPAAAVREHLARLQATEFLYETRLVPEPAYTFKHVLTQEAAYQALLPQARQAVHAQIAQIVEAHFPKTAETQPELLARHYTAAGLSVQAIPYWKGAGQRAVERSANLEAVAHLTTGLEVLATLPDTPERLRHELDMLTMLGPVLTNTRGPGSPAVEQVYTRARELCQQAGEPRQLFRVLWGLWRFYNYRTELQAAGELGRQLLILARQVQDPALLLEAHHALWPTLFYFGELAAARSHLEQGMALYNPQQHRAHAFLYAGHDPGSCCQAYMAWTLWALGYPDQALAAITKALTLAREFAHPASLAGTLSYAAVLHQFCRQRLAVQEAAETLIALATEQGDADGWRGGRSTRVGAGAQGQGTKGIGQMHQGLAALRATGAELRRPLFLALLAEAYREIGQSDGGYTCWPRRSQPWSKLEDVSTKRSYIGSRGSCCSGRPSQTRTKPKPAFIKASRWLAASKRSRWSCGRR